MNAVLEALTEVELAGADVLSCKSELVALDRKRQSLREAQRVCKADSKNAKRWFYSGNMFLSLSSEICKTVLEKDMKQTEEEIEQQRNSLKLKVDRLFELEGRAKMNTGFQLKALNNDEINSLNKLLH